MMRSSLLIMLLAALPAFAQEVGPDGKPIKQITSKDKGPDIDPKKLTASKYSGVPLFRTFRSFMSSAYAFADVWVYAENDDQAIYDEEIIYPYPESYTPTWGEMFDHVARQIKGKWEFDPKNRQFKFSRAEAGALYEVKLAEGWRREDRGLYTWHAPKGAQMGMDIYFLGHYMADEKTPDLMDKAREHAAMFIVGRFPTPPKVEAMERVKTGDAEALYIKMDTPRPGGVWRQWALVKDGHAILIVSAMPKEQEKEISAAVDEMVKTFGAVKKTN